MQTITYHFEFINVHLLITINIKHVEGNFESALGF